MNIIRYDDQQFHNSKATTYFNVSIGSRLNNKGLALPEFLIEIELEVNK
ncbi:hypothetical protein [Lunatibacter salilacus]|nr:hypothetical protein [Lunatibacter salilacus]